MDHRNLFEGGREGRREGGRKASIRVGGPQSIYHSLANIVYSCVYMYLVLVIITPRLRMSRAGLSNRFCQCLSVVKKY